MSLVVVFALLPGALYTWAYEREAGSYGVTLADRTMRFAGVSALTHLLLGVPEYLLWRWQLAGADRLLAGQFTALFSIGCAVTLLPLAAGLLVGSAHAGHGARSARVGALLARLDDSPLRGVLGPTPPPRAWDAYFGSRPRGFIRVRTVDGEWLGGRYAQASAASVYPHDPDLLLDEAWVVNAEGHLVEPAGYRLYVPGSRIAWVEIVGRAEDGRQPDGTGRVPGR